MSPAQMVKNMKFLDKAKIRIISGHGGNGMVAWRREKYVDKGGRPEVTEEEAVIFISLLMKICLRFLILNSNQFLKLHRVKMAE